MSCAALALSQPDAHGTIVALPSERVIRTRTQGQVQIASMRTLGDDALVVEAKLGSEGALAELWHRHGKLARMVAWRITRNQEDTEDALQETFINSFRHLDQFKGESHFSTWLVRIATNSALMLLRRRRNHPEISIEGVDDDSTAIQFDFPDLSESIETRCIRREQIQHVRSAMERLPIRLRQVIEMQQRDELSLEEISRITGMSTSALKSRLFRARKALRESTSHLRSYHGSPRSVSSRSR